MEGFRRKKGGKAGFENPYCGPSFHNKTSWTPPSDRDSALNTYVGAIKHDILTINRNHITDNLTKDERQALRNLKKRRENQTS